MKHLIRFVLVLFAAVVGLIVGAALDSCFGGIPFDLPPVSAIVFAIAAACTLLCDAQDKS